MQFLDIGEVAQKAGIAASALRHYEAAGLIASVGRKGLRRQFPPEVLMQLKVIALCKTAGFTLEEIAGMFGRNGLPDLPRARLRGKADEIGAKIAELTALRATLEHMAACKAPSHLECPSFRRLIETAGKPGGGAGPAP